VTDTPAEREDEGAWAKLRRRKVVQWGFAYAAGAWGLLQVLQFLADTYDWPAQVLRLVTLALAVGFPIALTLAWYHGDRGHQKPARSEVAIIALLLLLGGGALWLYGHRSTPSQAATQSSPPQHAAAATTAPADARPSVAVLPFTNLSADPANEYLAEGIAETMITMLAQVPQLLVIGKNSSFSYKGRDIDSRAIGQQLDVGALLEGSVQRAGDRLRVAVQLVSTVDGRHLWAETYDRPTTDVFAVQDDIARRVTEALSVALAGNSSPGSIGTNSVAAYDAYLRGKQLVARREVKSLEEGVALLEKSVAVDPRFARAWIELSGAYYDSSRNVGATTIGRMPPDQAMALSERAARQAVMVAPQSGAAYAALATILIRQGKDGYREAHERAYQLSPNDPSVIEEYAYFLRWMNRPSEALKVFEPLLAVDPRNAVVRRIYAGLLDNNGDPTGALAQYGQVIRLEPEGVIPYFRASELVGQFTDRGDLALRLMRRVASLDPDNAMAWQDLALEYWAADDGSAVRDAMQQLHRLGAGQEASLVNAQIALYEAHPADARKGLEKLLGETPDDQWALFLLSTLRGSAQENQATLDRVESSVAEQIPEQRDGLFGDSRICLNAWLGHDQVAKELLSRLEPVWRSKPAFGWMGTGGRHVDLARSLACVGRNDDALTELEALLKEGYDIGWRDMATDSAFDAIRTDPRFRAVSDKLRAADAAAKARFRARPDLNDADIDSLGT